MKNNLPIQAVDELRGSLATRGLRGRRVPPFRSNGALACRAGKQWNSAFPALAARFGLILLLWP